MNQQTVFSIDPVEKYQLSDFIVSNANKIAFDIITSWPDAIWGNNPYSKTLLLIGPKSSGKTFLSRIWQQHHSCTNLRSLQIVIENIDQITNEEDLLHAFNTAHENGKFLLMTASNFPQFNLADLSSRINSVNTVNISYPDDELIKILIFKIFSSFSIKVSPDVINYLIKTLPREFNAIHSAINIINQKALVEKRKITIPFIKSCF